METLLPIRHRRLVNLLFAVTAGFAAINLGLHAWLAYGLYGYTPVTLLIPVFDLDTERNLPTLVEVALMLAAAGLLAAAALRARTAADGTAAGWWILAASFVLLAVDEAWSFHERLVAPSDGLLRAALPRFLSLSWVVPGMVGAAAVLVVLLRFLLRLPRMLAGRLLVAGMVFLGGAIGMEIAGTAYMLRPHPSMLVFSMLTTLEESMEMSGVILLIRALLADFAGGAAVLHIGLSMRSADPRLLGQPTAPHGPPAE